MRVAFVLILCLLTSAAHAKHLQPEKYYQARWCTDVGGTQEYRLPDNTRCDCLTETHAVEVDFGPKWPEAIGQALYYSLQTGKRAGIVLIVEKPEDRKYWIRLNSTIEHYGLPIDTWLEAPFKRIRQPQSS